MTGSLKARQPHRRDFSVSASIPVLSIARGSELWGFLGLGFLGVIGFSVYYCYLVRSATSSWCLLWGPSGFISFFMSFFVLLQKQDVLILCIQCLPSIFMPPLSVETSLYLS